MPRVRHGGRCDLGVGAVVLLCVLGRPDGAEPGATARAIIVPDQDGALRDVVLHFDPALEPEVGPTYRDLLRAFDAAVKVWVVVQGPAQYALFRRSLRAWGVADGPRFREVDVGAPITTWSRDRFTLLREGSRRVLLVRARAHRAPPARRNDWLAPFALARLAGPDIEARKAPLVFDGGDLVATTHHVFATAVLAWRNRGGPLGDPWTLERWLRRETGREPVLIGRTAEDVPLHHICMLITPLDERRVLVGDPEAGLALLPADARLPREADRSAETLRRFRNVAAALERHGFEVIRVPMVPLVDHLTYVTYNNTLLERRSDGRLHAYLPQFGIAPLDAAGRSAYARAGVVVHPIDVRGIYHRNGAVRCLINVLDRDCR